LKVNRLEGTLAVLSPDRDKTLVDGLPASILAFIAWVMYAWTRHVAMLASGEEFCVKTCDAVGL